ncbi:MAG TPA: TlpA disulfide reductase family protein [Mycobacteriales bacterium]|jgi:thiol-disulfide isomerase/thioredoxin|nr:TlpA disulfide reductase family protein [Mycobacteriales bacterium]
MPWQRTAARACAAVLAAAALAACTGGHGAVSTDSGTDRFVAGNGVATFVPAAKRKAAVAVAGTTVDGAPLDLASLRGTPVVVNVWGSWCAPCKTEQPVLNRVAAATAGRVRFVGIDIREGGRPAAKQHLARYGVTYPSLYDPSVRLLPHFDPVPRATPTTYVLDPRGRVAAYVFGEVEEAALRRLVDRVLAEPAA